MEERTVKISATEYKESMELKGRVTAALIFLETDDYVSKNVLIGILKGEPISVPAEDHNDK